MEAKPTIAAGLLQLLTEAETDASPPPPNVEVMPTNPRHASIDELSTEHRGILNLKRRGWTNSEIGEVFGRSVPEIVSVVRQEWFQRHLLALIKADGPNGIRSFVQRQFEDSLLALVYLRDNAKSETVRMNCAIHFLDRFLGRVVPAVAQNGEFQLAEDEEAAVKTELQKVRREKEELLRDERQGGKC
jgi:hypothetical protein